MFISLFNILFGTADPTNSPSKIKYVNQPEQMCCLCIICLQLASLYILYTIKVGVNPSLKKEMWLLMHLITKKTCTKMYKSIHFWNQKNQMNPMVATDFCKIMRFSRNSSVTMVTIEFFLESITKFWFY